MHINVGDMVTYINVKNSWNWATLGDIYICFTINGFGTQYVLQSVGSPTPNLLSVSDVELSYHFKLLVSGNKTLPPGFTPHIPATLSNYSIGDKLILTQFHQSMPGFVNLGEECVITRVTSQPLVLFDLNETRTNRYIGSFSESELNNWFMKMGTISVSSAYRRVGNEVSFNIVEPIKKKECDCGAKKTYGENCNEFSHSHWCDTLKKD